MKFKISSFAALLAAATLISSGSEGKYWDEPSDNAVYTFPKPAATFNLKAGETLEPYDVVITRNNAGPEETIDLITYFNDDEAFSVPSSVTFAAGKTSTVCTISINTDVMAIGVTYTAQLATPNFETLTKADSLLVPDGKFNPIYPGDIYPSQTNCKFTLNVRLNYTWKSLGWVDYTDDMIGALYGAPPVTYRVPIEVPVEEAGKGVYRLVDPYGYYYPYNEPGDWDSSVTTYLEINAQNPEQVYIPTCETAANWGDGIFICSSMAYLLLNRGMTPAEVAEEGVFGSVENGLITFPAESLLVGFKGGEGFYYSNPNGAFCVNLNSISDEE